jgi:hypothetical protein
MKIPNYMSHATLASLAYGTFLFASSAPAQNVGIGISTPQSKLIDDLAR